MKWRKLPIGRPFLERFQAKEENRYPFNSGKDFYTDDRLRELAADPDIPWNGDGIQVHHNRGVDAEELQVLVDWAREIDQRYIKLR